MPVFDSRFYDGPNPRKGGVEAYRHALLEAAKAEQDTEALVRQEVTAITKAITDGIRALIEEDRRVGDLVRSGVVPLATWTDALLKIASMSREAMQRKIAEMERELQHGKVQGFPATLFMAGKPSFTTFKGFYEVAFNLNG